MRCVRQTVRFMFSLLTVLSLAVSSHLARGQEPQVLLSSSATSDRADTGLPTITISKQVNEVNLVFTVTDSKGRFVDNLSLSNFAVLDNHLPPQALDYFQQQTDLPLRVALLIDTSDSIQYRLRYEKQAASTFFRKVLRPEVDKAFVVVFDRTVHLVQDLTGDVEVLADAVNRLKSDGDTAFYDAIVFACNKLRKNQELQVTRRAVIVISDGVDTVSHALLSDAQQAAARAEVVMFALSTNDRTSDPHSKGDAVLDLLSRPTGGHILPARENGDLKRAFRDIEKTLRSQYVLAYHPADFKADGSFRSIEIIPQRPGLKAQCRSGYFAPHEEAGQH